MRCAEIQAGEPLWRRGELTDSESRALVLHMARCPACRRACRSARRFDAALRAGLAEAAAPVGLRSRLRRSLAKGTRPAASGWGAPLALAATVALLALQSPASTTVPAGAGSRVVEGWLVCEVCARAPSTGRARPGCTRQGAGHRTAVLTGDGVIRGLAPAAGVLGLSIAPQRRGTRVRLSVRGATEGDRDLVVESARLL